MNDLFANLLELDPPLYHGVYSLELLNGVYGKLGYLTLGIPLLLMVLFYILWRYPFGKWFHWVIWWLLGGVLVSIFTNRVLGATLYNYLYDPTGFPDVKSFVLNIDVACGLYALLAGIIFSMFLKQFPRPQSHLPFVTKRK